MARRQLVICDLPCKRLWMFRYGAESFVDDDVFDRRRGTVERPTVRVNIDLRCEPIELQC